MTIEYDGTDFAGWQKQPGGTQTVQGLLETTLSGIVREPVRLIAAGRTDKGVHARGQVANFTTESAIDLRRLGYSVNRLLPSTVYVRDMQEGPATFHSRFSALLREYRYFILEKPSAIENRFAAYHRKKPDVEVLNACAGEIIGRHDFSMYSAHDARDENPFCSVYAASWKRDGEKVVFRITANRFLRTMVRYLVSAQLEATPGEIADALQSGRAAKKPFPANPAGLFLWRVVY